MPLADHGAFDGNQNAVKIKSEDKNEVYNVNSVSKPKGGNRKEYLLRRLSRDFPQALDRIQAGELSTRKAAIEYGIVRHVNGGSVTGGMPASGATDGRRAKIRG